MSSFHDLLSHAQAEELIFSSVLKKDFKKLKLPSFTYPHHYQELPRQSPFLLHKNFDDLHGLKLRLIDKAILWTYNKALPKKPFDLVIFTYVIPGGLGDYFAGMMVMDILKHLPHARLHFMPIICERAPKLHHPTHGQTHEIRFASSESLSKENLSLSIFNSYHMHILEKASLVLQVPTIFPLWNTLLDQFQKQGTPLSHESLGEYGFIHSDHFNPKTSSRCMGLHFLEMGLFAHSQTEPYQWSLIEGLIYKLTLMKLSAHSFFFAYLYTRNGHQLYLHMLIQSLKNEVAPIHIFTPDIGKFLLLAEKIHKDLSLKQIFIQGNIQSIEWIFLGKQSIMPLQKNGKKLSIYHTGPLSRIEFLHFLHFSKDPVGIRGNLSVSEALSMKKTFFYDPIEHNLTFHQGLVALAEKKLISYPSSHKLLKYSSEACNLIEAGKNLAKAASNPKTKGGFQRLSEIILEEHRVNELIECLVKRHLLHKTSKEVFIYEEKLKSLFLEGSISFKKLIEKLNLKIKTILEAKN